MIEDVFETQFIELSFGKFRFFKGYLKTSIDGKLKFISLKLSI